VYNEKRCKGIEIYFVFHISTFTSSIYIAPNEYAWSTKHSLEDISSLDELLVPLSGFNNGAEFKLQSTLLTSIRGAIVAILYHYL
jgi:hypothetical protein